MAIDWTKVLDRAQWLLWLVPAAIAVWLGAHVTSVAPPDPIPPPTEDTRFGVSDEKRREVFETFAREGQQWRKDANRRFPNDPWTAEDDFRNKVRLHLERFTDRFDLDRTTLHLIYDEAVRRRWKGPDGEPLKATTVPLHKRK